jgi:hypothetical protein
MLVEFLARFFNRLRAPHQALPTMSGDVPRWNAVTG